MSLYNMLHGRNPFSLILLRVLGIDQSDGKWRSGRFRDIHLNKEGDKIILYTRNGGGNREHWDDSEDSSEGLDCDCTGCTIMHHIPQHPNYIRDWDDDFDSTYAYISFSIPEEHKVLVREFMTGDDPKTIHEKFASTMVEMESMSTEDLKKDSRFKPLLGLFDNINNIQEVDDG